MTTIAWRLGHMIVEVLGDRVLHINREMLHHTAEVMLLRDLYRTAGPDRLSVPTATV